MVKTVKNHEKLNIKLFMSFPILLNFSILSGTVRLFMSYLCDPSFIFIFVFIIINRIISWSRHNCSFAYFLDMFYYFWMITLMKNVNNFQIAKVQSQSVAYHLLDFLPISFNLVFFIKVLLVKKACIVGLCRFFSADCRLPS